MGREPFTAHSRFFFILITLVTLASVPMPQSWANTDDDPVGTEDGNNSLDGADGSCPTVQVTSYAAGCGGVEGGRESSYGGDPRMHAMDADTRVSKNPGAWVMAAGTQVGGTKYAVQKVIKLGAFPGVEFHVCDHFAQSMNGRCKIDISVASCEQKDKFNEQTTMEVVQGKQAECKQSRGGGGGGN